MSSASSEGVPRDNRNTEQELVQISGLDQQEGDNKTESSLSNVELLSECSRLELSIAQHLEHATVLEELAAHERSQAERDKYALDRLLQSIGRPAIRESLGEYHLRGKKLREVALDILTKHQPPGQPIHYREWYQLVREAGYTIGGKDPTATFLTNVAKLDTVASVGKRSGLYVYNEAPDPAT